MGFIDFRRDPVAHLRAIWSQRGDHATFGLGPLSFHLIAHPEVARDLLVADPSTLGRMRGFGGIADVTGTSVLTTDGEAWRAQRRLLVPLFREERIDACRGAIAEEIEAQLARWPRKQRGFRPWPRAEALVRRVVARVLMGKAQAERLSARVVEPLLAHVTWRMRWLVPLPRRWPLPHHRRLRRALDELDGIVAAALDQPEGLLATLVAQRDPRTGRALTREAVRDVVVTLLITGYRTTAVALAHLLTELGMHPTLRSAPASLLVRETLRLHPPAWALGRAAKRPIALDGVELRRGAQLIVCPYLIHRHPRLWEAPEAFRPDRMRQACEKSRFIPYGAGPRKCPGEPLAQAVLTEAVARITRRLRLSDGRREAPAAAGITLAPPRSRLTIEAAA